MAALLAEGNPHELPRLAKDIAAAAVVVSIVGAVIAGGLVLGPPLAERVGVAPAWSGLLARAGVLFVVVAGALGLLSFLRRPTADERKGARRRTS